MITSTRIPVIGSLPSWGGLFIVALMVLTSTVPNTALAMKGGVPSTEPWVLRVVGSSNGDTLRCTGAAINDHIVITATHCGALGVVFGDHTAGLYGAYPIVDTDITVLVLAAGHPLSAYAKLRRGKGAASALFPAGTQASAYGFSLSNPQEQLRLTLQVRTVGLNSEKTEIFVMHNANGEIEDGDSGGPLLINGVLVGVMSSTGSHEGADVSVYESIVPALKGIAELDHQRKARAYMSSEL